jgi:two-component system sensor histidine kinase KdpD
LREPGAPGRDRRPQDQELAAAQSAAARHRSIIRAPGTPVPAIMSAMRARSHTLLIGDRPRPLALGLAVALAGVAVTTVAIYPLRGAAPVVSLGVLYLLAVLLVSSGWGLGLGLLTAVLSAATFNWFHLSPRGRFHLADSENWVALGVLLAAAAIASSLAEIARARTAEAERRREEADLAAAMARTLLGRASLDAALPVAAGQLAAALDLPAVRIDAQAALPPEGMSAITLDVGRADRACLLIPDGLDPRVRERLIVRVVPALEALLAAAVERERLQREAVDAQVLRRSDELKTALLRSVSHDLRTPLTAIMAAGEGIRSSTLEPEGREELASMIVGEASRLSRVVEQLLDLSRLQAGVAAPRRDWCALEEVVGSAIEHLPTAVQAAVTVDMPPELPLVRADPAQLERVFGNLLENATRYAPGGPVEVRGQVVAGGVEVSVGDHGPGISADDLPHVFEPFRRGADRSGHAGAGLGLAIVKGLVEANGGSVRAGAAPGGGASFTVGLPVAAAAPAGVELAG